MNEIETYLRRKEMVESRMVPVNTVVECINSSKPVKKTVKGRPIYENGMLVGVGE